MYEDSPLVTVYIPCKNYGHYLAQAVSSVQNQLYPNWELFIVDDASEDGSSSIANHLRSRDPERIKVIINNNCEGLQRIANRILELAAGRYIVRLDADDWFEEAALLLMVAKLESDPRLGLVYGNYFYTDQYGQVIGVERRRKLGEEDLAGHFPPHGACTMVRTRTLKAVGGYSEDVQAQDGWELWYKLAQRVKAANLEAPLFYYRQHGGSFSRDSRKLLASRAKIINKLRTKLEGSYTPSCLAVIPVRESYPGFEGVPYREIGGKSMLQRALEAAQGAHNVTEVAVSSNAKVLEFSRELAERGNVSEHMRIERAQEKSESRMSPREILLHASECYQEKYQNCPDIVLFLNLHAPLRQAGHVDSAVDMLRINACDSVVSVCEEREPMFVQGRNGLKLLNPGRFDNINYEREKIYQHNGAVIAVWWEVLKDYGLFGENIGYIEMGHEESIQIKSHLRIKMLEHLKQDCDPLQNDTKDNRL